MTLKVDGSEVKEEPRSDAVSLAQYDYSNEPLEPFECFERTDGWLHVKVPTAWVSLDDIVFRMRKSKLKKKISIIEAKGALEN